MLQVAGLAGYAGEECDQKPNSLMYNFAEVSGHILESSQTDLRFPYTMFTLQTSFDHTFAQGGGGGV